MVESLFDVWNRTFSYNSIGITNDTFIKKLKKTDNIRKAGEFLFSYGPLLSVENFVNIYTKIFKNNKYDNTQNIDNLGQILSPILVLPGYVNDPDFNESRLTADSYVILPSNNNNIIVTLIIKQSDYQVYRYGIMFDQKFYTELNTKYNNISDLVNNILTIHENPIPFTTDILI